jgi:hypothetical protein
MSPDPELRREALHNVFWGVNRDDYEFVDRTLHTYAQRHLYAGHQEGHLQGFVIGIAIGALIGVITCGLLYTLF